MQLLGDGLVDRSHIICDRHICAFAQFTEVWSVVDSLLGFSYD